MQNQLVSKLKALGYTSVIVHAKEKSAQVHIECVPAHLRDENKQWPALSLLNKAGIIPEDVREFGGALLITGADLTNATGWADAEETPAKAKK